jgi:hypothetical protein
MHPSQIPPPLRRSRSIARSRSFCSRTRSGDAVPCALPLMPPVVAGPVGRAVPSPGCPVPSSRPVRARGVVLPVLVSPVVGDSDPDGAADESGAGPVAGAEAPDGAAGEGELTPAPAPELVPAPPPAELPPVEPPPDAPPPAWASAPAQPMVREAANVSEMMAWRMGVPSGPITLGCPNEFTTTLRSISAPSPTH